MVSEDILHDGKPEELYARERNVKILHKGPSDYFFEVLVDKEEFLDPEDELLHVEIWVMLEQHAMSATELEGIMKLDDGGNELAPEDLEGEDKGAIDAMKHEWGHAGVSYRCGSGRWSQGTWVGFLWW